MADTAPLPDLDKDDSDAGEFLLPYLDPAPADNTDEERARYDEQILAALVSP